MVLWSRSRLSLRFWMAEADISREIFRDTVVTIAPKMEKNKMISKSRERPLALPCLFGFALIGAPSFHMAPRPAGAFGRRCRPCRSGAADDTKHYSIGIWKNQ